MTVIRIRGRLMRQYTRFGDRRRIRKGNYCKLCGCPLTDPISIQLGYGHKCIKNIPVVIILEIPAASDSGAKS